MGSPLLKQANLRADEIVHFAYDFAHQYDREYGSAGYARSFLPQHELRRILQDKAENSIPNCGQDDAFRVAIATEKILETMGITVKVATKKPLTFTCPACKKTFNWKDWEDHVQAKVCAYGRATTLPVEAAFKTAYSEDTLYAHFDSQQEVAFDLLEEYKAHRLEPSYTQRWTLVPAARLKKIWNDYAKLGFVRDEKGIDQIASIIITNIHKLEVNTILTGHTSMSPSIWANEQTGEEYPEDYFQDGESFFDDENGNWRLSDFAMDDLQGYAMELREADSAEEKLQIIDHILNVVHRRSDLASWFVEGGRSTLNALAGTQEKAEEAIQNKLTPKGRGLVDKARNKSKVTASKTAVSEESRQMNMEVNALDPQRDVGDRPTGEESPANSMAKKVDEPDKAYWHPFGLGMGTEPESVRYGSWKNPLLAHNKEDENVLDTGTYDEEHEAHVRKEVESWAQYAEDGESFDPTGDYFCGTCDMRSGDDECLRVAGKISFGGGGCRLYRKGDPEQQPPMKEKLSKEDAGYEERPEGFGCKRCEYGGVAEEPDSEGRPGWCGFWGMHITPNACCAENDAGTNGLIQLEVPEKMMHRASGEPQGILARAAHRAAKKAVFAGRLPAHKIAGQWGDRSYDSDAAHDTLDRWRPKGAEQTQGFDEPIPEKNMLPLLEELNATRPVANDDIQHYVGIVVFLLEHGSRVPASYRQRAQWLLGRLLHNEKYIQGWKNPEARRNRMRQEFTILTGKTAAGPGPAVQFYDTTRTLPPRNDLRTHIDENLIDNPVKDDREEDKKKLEGPTPATGHAPLRQDLAQRSRFASTSSLAEAAKKLLEKQDNMTSEDISLGKDKAERDALLREIQKAEASGYQHALFAAAPATKGDVYWEDLIYEREQTAKNRFEHSPGIRQVMQDNGWTMEQAWDEMGRDFANALYDPRNRIVAGKTS